METPKETKPLTPQERLEIAVANEDNDGLLRASLVFVKSQIASTYPNAQFKSITPQPGDAIDDILDVFFPRSPSYALVNKILIGSHKYEYESKLVSTGYENGGILRVHVRDDEICRACQEVTNLSGGRIRTQI